MSEANEFIFVVDDDPDIRSSLTRSLRIRGFEAIAFASGADFLRAYDSSQIACLILDQGMPDMTGLELQRHLKERGFAIPIIFITGHGGVRESVEAMKGGAIDFLEKPFRQADLIDAIRNALQLAHRLQVNNQKGLELKQRFERLTPREKEIVNHMLANPSEVSSKEIGRHLNISPRTVDNHRARILEKLAITSVVELARWWS